MHAILLNGIGGIDQLQYSEIAPPVPKSDEAFVRVLFCGVNHLDLHIRTGRRSGIPSFPHILGSEIVGEVVELPTEKTAFKKGDIVVLYPWTFCGDCLLCRNDSEQICDRGSIIGRTRWGGYATHVTVSIKNLIKLPSDLNPEFACAVTLVGPTAYHLIQRANIPNNATVLLTGATGGVGMVALQLLKKMKCRVICATSHIEKSASLLSSGAWKTVAASSLSKDVLRIVPEGVSYAIDLVGGPIWTQSVQSLAKHGTLVFCATSKDDPAQIPLHSSFARELVILGSYGGSRKDLAATLQLLQSGDIQPVISNVYDLSDAAKAHDALEQQKNVGKILLRV